jgi:hypothetical protein
LYQWAFAGGFEAVNFAGFDYEDVAGGAFEGLAVYGPYAAAFADKLDFVVYISGFASTNPETRG